MIKYIYPQWTKAKIDLAEALNLNDEQKVILNDWFRNHCFEFGCTTAVSKRDLIDSENKKEVEYHALRRNLHEIVETLARKGLVQQNQIDHRDYLRIYETRILIFGYSPLGVIETNTK